MSPDYFPFGSDVDEIKRLPNAVFYKRFKKKSYANFCKTIFVLNLLKEEDFVPKLHRYTSGLELYLSDCGNLLQISTLPWNWEQQLLAVKKVLLRHQILFKDWGLWELNPFILNNLCLKEGRIYFVDIGDAIAADTTDIEYYFSKKIRAIRLVLTYGYYYLIYHYLRRIFIMFYRKFKVPANVIILALGFYLFN
jgi:hypothetical protein